MIRKIIATKRFLLLWICQLNLKRESLKGTLNKLVICVRDKDINFRPEKIGETSINYFVGRDFECEWKREGKTFYFCKQNITVIYHSEKFDDVGKLCWILYQ